MIPIQTHWDTARLPPYDDAITIVIAVIMIITIVMIIIAIVITIIIAIIMMMITINTQIAHQPVGGESSRHWDGTTAAWVLKEGEYIFHHLNHCLWSHHPTLHHYDMFPPSGNMTGGNMLVGHDHHHHQHFQQEQKLQEPDSVAVLKEQLQLFDNQEREKQLLELQTKMDEVYFFFFTFF